MRRAAAQLGRQLRELQEAGVLAAEQERLAAQAGLPPEWWSLGGALR